MFKFTIGLVGIIFFSYTITVSHAEEECGEFSQREITIDSGTKSLTSPGYENGSFSPGQLCVWKLNPGSEGNKFVRISITDIDLPKHQRCDDSYLEINYLDSVPPYLRFCGTSPKEHITIGLDKEPTITFYSSRVPGEGKGFKITLEAVESEQTCGSDEHKCGYPFKCVPSSSKCNGIYDCNDGTDEENCADKFEAEPKDICGTTPSAPDTTDGDRIVGGQEAIPHSWPWQISIQGNYIYPSGHSCGGTLLNNQWVLTAGHCVAGTFWKVLRVRLGLHSQFDPEAESMTRNVKLIVFHPEYNRFTALNDLALIQLSAPVKYSSVTQPACLPHYFDKEEINEETTKVQRLFATGWGETMERGLYDRLRQVSSPFVPYESCRQQHSNLRDVPDKTICTGYSEGGRNPCFGDSGGPLVKLHSSEKRWVLQGVVSWGPTICGQAGSPTVYAKVADYADWIKETLLEN